MGAGVVGGGPDPLSELTEVGDMSNLLKNRFNS